MPLCFLYWLLGKSSLKSLPHLSRFYVVEILCRRENRILHVINRCACTCGKDVWGNTFYLEKIAVFAIFKLTLVVKLLSVRASFKLLESWVIKADCVELILLLKLKQLVELVCNTLWKHFIWRLLKTSGMDSSPMLLRLLLFKLFTIHIASRYISILYETICVVQSHAWVLY
jgi:hypothetical protein